MGLDASKLRLFVAIAVPHSIREAVAQTQQILIRAASRSQAAWTKPDQFHLTLKFLGSVESERVQALVSELQGECAAFAPMRIEAKGAGFFPSATRPRVAWVGLEDTGHRLGELHSRIESAVGDFTQEKPENRFHPHITVGRFKHLDSRDRSAIRKWSDELLQRSFGAWDAKEVVLMQSLLSPKGAVHSPLAILRLGP